MAWDPTLSTTGNALYFGPLAGYNTEELDRRGLDQDKKTLKGFKWFSLKDSIPVSLTSTTTLPEKVSSESSKNHAILPQVSAPQNESEDIPTWDVFTRTTTFHGIRYIFDKTPFRLRR